MKKHVFVMCMLATLMCFAVLAGCTDTKQAETTDVLQNTMHIDQIPDVFANVIENDLFNGATAFRDRLLKAESLTASKEDRTTAHRIQMMDLYGNDLAAYNCNSDDAYDVIALTATRDGGFLFVLGFYDYAYDRNTWASDNGFASRIIKCDKNGDLQFETPLDGVEGSALKYCFEKDDKFYFFGTYQTPETAHRGVWSYTDIYMTVLDSSGAVINTKSIAGSNYDGLDAAEAGENGFVLSISSQSSNGDFKGSSARGYPVDWAFAVNEDLEITGREVKSGRGIFDTRLGEKDGVPIYKSDSFLEDFDAGTPGVFVDYGNFYLIVSTQNTGEYEKTPLAISATWYYTESVYSFYDNSGKLLFRSSVDSTPDYEALMQGS